MLAIRKCRKVACLQRNKDTAFARFVAVRRNRVAVHKNFGKVRVCGIDRKVSPTSLPLLHRLFLPSVMAGASLPMATAGFR